MKSDPFKSGADAYFDGVPRNRNPWCEDYPNYREQWFAGWDATRDEVENAPATVPMSEIPKVTFVYETEYGNPVG